MLATDQLMRLASAEGQARRRSSTSEASVSLSLHWEHDVAMTRRLELLVGSFLMALALSGCSGDEATDARTPRTSKAATATVQPDELRKKLEAVDSRALANLLGPCGGVGINTTPPLLTISATDAGESEKNLRDRLADLFDISVAQVDVTLLPASGQCGDT